MEQHSREPSSGSSELLSGGWFDPIEVAIRERVRGFIETLVEAELDEALGRSRVQQNAGLAETETSVAGGHLDAP